MNTTVSAAHVDHDGARRARRSDGADATLAAALVAREPAAATHAWLQLSPLVLGIMRRQLGAEAETRDLCQEVFMRFFRRIDELRNPSALRGFVVGISLGVARNERRRTQVRRLVSLTTTGELPPAVAGQPDFESREALFSLHRLLASTSAEDRALFLTRYVDQKDLAEIAAATGRPLWSVKRRLARATRRLRAGMRHDGALAVHADALRTIRATKRTRATKGTETEATSSADVRAA